MTQTTHIKHLRRLSTRQQLALKQAQLEADNQAIRSQQQAAQAKFQQAMDAATGSLWLF